jgi:hypothetical protein
VDAFPEWACDYIREWRGRLFLQQWEIRCDLARVVNGDEDVRGKCQQYPDRNLAVLTFRDDLADTAEWRNTIIHELLHVLHARIDHYTESAIIPEVAEASQQLASVGYRQHLESFIDMLTRTLYLATCHFDYPEEYPS